MVACPDSEKTAPHHHGVAERAHERRTGRELVVELVFGPLAGLLVRGLLRLRVPPTAVVLANGAAGGAAAVAVVRGELVAAALLLQLKTVLDNADGRLARESGRTTALGRYLDTEVDLVVNIAVLSALAYETGSYVLAAAALASLTVVLSADFNEDVLRRGARGETVETEPSPAREGRLAEALASAYRVVFRPQDRALQGLARRRLERLLAGVSDSGSRQRRQLAYHDVVTATVLANLGLSTQLAVLGVFLAVGAPVAYLWAVLGCAALLPVIQLRREWVARRVPA